MALTNLLTSLVLDVYDHDTTPTTVKAIALDKQTRYIKATLTYRGADYPVDENATVTLTVIRPDKTGVQVTGSVVDVDNADRTGTIKGVSAELSQTALAVKGNLKAQFMVSVGDQILRTEIFAIKNGEALDADVSEWAGEYQGYNLDELVQDVADAKAAVSEMESDVSDLKEGLNSIVEASELWSDPVPQANITRIENKNFTSSNGIQDKAGWSLLYWQADADGLYDFVFSKSQTQNSVRIFSSSNFSSSTYIKTATKLSDSHKQTEVKAGQYIVAQSWYLDYTLTIKRSEGTAYSIPKIDEAIKAEEANIFPDGWMHLPTENFSRNEWKSYNGTTSRAFRVKYDLPLKFAWDVTLLASQGFYLDGYKFDGTSLGTDTTIIIPANTLFKVYVRRINENQSEIADIDEFASALNISTPLAGIEKYKHTFTDVTMFPRIGISGDSFSAGGGIISGITSLTWGKNLERMSGVTVDIYAKSGESIVQWNADANNGLPALLAGEECGLYWFAHGINGTSTDASIGTPDDMSANPKPQTFYGQYVYAIEAVQRMFPKARIVIATIMGTGYSLYQTQYKKVNTAIRNIAEYCNIPLVDLAEDDFYKSVWYGSNHRSNHPTAMLNAGIAHANRRILAKTIMDNTDYFVDYGDKYNFAVSCPVVTGGYVSANPNIVASGETVTLSNTAYDGYHFVRYESDDVTITNGSFTMPSKKVTVIGVFESD